MTDDIHGAALARFAAGSAQGVREGGLTIWRGLPYALPPARWQPPQPMPPWQGIRDASRFGPACAQSLRRPGSVYDCDIPDKSEDCLYLNIWAPDGAQGLPVLVWIHGGNLLRGAGSEPLCDGAALARRGLVVVTINYRLGVLGYLAHPDLSARSPQGISGNYGLMDQIAALDWVQRNIAAVGGDPGNVTVAGESAGALSVYYLMCAPAARGLFHRAIAQSGHLGTAQGLRDRLHGMEPGEAAGARLVKAMGATGLDDLLAMEAQDLAVRAVAAGFAAQAVVDGVVLPDQPLTLFETGQAAPVPLITGFNFGEILTLEFLMPPVLPDTPARYEAEIRARYGDLADRFLGVYPAGDIKASTEAAVRDALFSWTALKGAQTHGANGRPAWVYYFDHGYPAADDRGLHAFHAAELAYLFDTMDVAPPNWPKAPATPAEADLTRVIGDYWAAFAKDGVPVAAGAPAWPAYRDGGAILHFADVPQVRRDLMPGMFDLMDEVVRRRRAAGDQPWNWNAGVAAPPLRG